MAGSAPMPDSPLAWLPVSRSRALTRALAWLAPAAILSVTTIAVYRGLHFVPSGVSNRLVDYSIALVAVPIPLTALYSAFHALRWLSFAAWPAPLGIVASLDRLTLRLGPFGTSAFDVSQLDIRYPYELSDDEDDAGFEAFLPEEQQRATLLPRIVHSRTRLPLHSLILKFAAGREADIAAALRPAIERWRPK